MTVVTDVNLMDKFAALRARQQEFAGDGADPTRVIMERIVSATEAIVAGRPTILAGTNNYLGLTFDPECIAAGQAALAEQGTGTTGSRMANGNYQGHGALERELAEFYGVPYAMVFSTGYSANLGTLAALLGPEDCVLLDADAHASLYDGCKMTGADVYLFKHNDPDSLDKRLRRLRERATRSLVVTEGLFSVLGDEAPLAEIAAVTKRHGAYLFVDEAHSLGGYGEHGRGVAEEAGVLDDVDFVVGTFSKSLGATGGYCVSRHDVLSLFRFASRPYIFTASPCPSVVATTRVALRHVRERPELKTRLWENARALHGGLSDLGLRLGADPSPVVAVRFEEKDRALATWRRLLELGVYTNLMVPPASPDGSSLLRCSASAAHTLDQIDRIVDGFRRAIADTDESA
ncbi:MAG: aminotransferase class I/II-fold pyridoxal phosphate-dependent enzyme [Pseudomonadales bacterium]